MNGNLESFRPSTNLIPVIEHHMARAQVPKGFIVDRQADPKLWSHINTLFAPLGPKHIFGNDKLPLDPSTKKELQRLQTEWGTGEDSFPAIIFTPRGTMEFNIEWAMVRADNFEDTPDKLVNEIQRARERLGVQDKIDYWIRSLEFVYAAVTGERPPGSAAPRPLRELPVMG